MSKQTFASLGLDSKITSAAHQLGFKEPTPVQSQVIPSILNHNSVIAQSQTGSGKTHAFLLPLFDRLDEDESGVQFIVVVPTRELATEIHDKIKAIIQDYGGYNWTAKLIIGGTDKQKMINKLKQPPSIVVGTPGRILDMVNEGALSLYSAQSFVIDEADLMTELGLINEVDQLLVKSHPEVQLLIF